MDGLALLCNLFADGPVTLKRLRLARVGSLAELERTTPERLAEWLHASLPQARAFVEEARRLLSRLAEESAQAPPLPHARAQAPAAVEHASASEQSAPVLATPLRPGALPGLDADLCARLERQKVRTLQALSERAGLDLARRTGIPYSRLLELARAARRVPAERGRAYELEVETRAFELRPAQRRATTSVADAELAGSDAFTLPLAEPDSAGPFG